MLRREIITWERECVHTSDLGKLLGECRFEFTLRYTICAWDRFLFSSQQETRLRTAIEQDPFREFTHRLSISPEQVLSFACASVIAYTLTDEGTYHTHILQILYDFPRGRLHAHPGGILHCVRVDTSDQGSERRAPSVPRRRVCYVAT